MANKRVEEPEVNNNNNGHEESEKARVILVNHLTNTPRNRMAETTVIPRRMVAALAISKTFAELVPGEDNKKNGNESFILNWMQNYFQLMRSVGGSHKRDLVMLAENQMAEEEEAENPYDTP